MGGSRPQPGATGDRMFGKQPQWICYEPDGTERRCAPQRPEAPREEEEEDAAIEAAQVVKVESLPEAPAARGVGADLARAAEMGVSTARADEAAAWSFVQGNASQRENAQGAAGKSINAKALNGRAPEEMSTLLHAAYGLENYPNYLLKWDPSKVDDLVGSLERQLAQARAAQAALAARAAYVATYEPLHGYLRSPKREDVLCASALAAAAGDGDWGVVDEHGGQIFSFPLLKERFCRDLGEEFAHYLAFRAAYVAESGGEREPPGTLRERLTLAEVGLASLEGFFLGALQSLIAALFPGPVGAVDHAHGYTVGYGAAEDPARNVTRKALIPHTDDAEVTLNVCLADGFTGGQLKFHGLRAPTTVHPMDLPNRDEFAYTHRLGRAVLHRGAHFHEVQDVDAGHRHVLICWFKSWASYRAAHCPCCLKFRRDVCVCSPSWN